MSAPVPGTGELFLIATPIGNLDDLSPRARALLAQVDLIAAEDTRHTGLLLRRLGIDRPLVSLHEHNESARTDTLLTRLREGASVALVSDAGTPLISDPGYELVRGAIAGGVRTVPVPGPCAAIVALTVAGLPTDRFVFEGFLPGRREARCKRLEALRGETRTIVFYESPHRLHDALADLVSAFGADRPGCVARELTKVYESVYRGTLQALASAAGSDPDMSRGELVIVVGGAPAIPLALSGDIERVVAVLLRELPPAQAAKLAARLTGAPRARLYELATGMAGGTRNR